METYDDLAKLTLPAPEDALPGRGTPLTVSDAHHVNGHSLQAPFPEGLESATFGLGCFWGAEPLFWKEQGVWVTAAGYAGGHTPNPTYEEVCSGGTGHTEVVLVVYDPRQISFFRLMEIFWQSHDPTQGMRQGNDQGTQYRSATYCTTEEQLRTAEVTREVYEHRLAKADYGHITTEVRLGVEFFYAEEGHQQYLAKNSDGYCGLKGTGVGIG